MNSKQIWRQTLRQPRYLLAMLMVLMAFGVTGVQAQDAPPNGVNGDYNGNYGGPDQPNGRVDYDVPDRGQDPPTRVARLSFLDGSVSFQPGGQGDWAEAVRNRPVTIGDKIWVDNNGRAELQAGQSSIHVGSMTALSFLNLDNQTTQMRLAEGTLNFRVRELREGDVYEVDTPNVVFTVTEAGAFRIDVNENGDATRVTVIRGEGEVSYNGETQSVHAGERGEFTGVENEVKYFVAGAAEPDDFDRWANSRDLRDDNSVSARYVSRDVPGYSDLDENGSWNEEPDYGPVWYPNEVDAGWAPYSYGYWSYVGPWGWTWVDYAPWGFAPFHYGRWAFIGSRWGWCPGPYYAYPIYGPAFVGFLGGRGWSVGFGFGGGWGGGIGWFPLGPHEPFCPWYRTSNVYVRNVNISNTFIRNTTTINNINVNHVNNFNYAYSHNVNAVTVASRSNFVNGQAINRGAFHVTEASLRGAQVSNRTGFAPTHQSYFGGASTHGNVSRPSAAVQERAVMARTTPAAAASHMPVRTFGGNSGARGGVNNGNSGGARGPMYGRAAGTDAAVNRNRPSFGQGAPQNSGGSARQNELSNDKPASHMRRATENTPGGNNNGNRVQGSAANRNWSAQGNATDNGRGPAGFSGNAGQKGNNHSADRPAWAGTRGNAGYSVNPRSSIDNNRPNSSNSNRGSSRSYDVPQRSGPSNDRTGYSANPRSNIDNNRPNSSNSNRGSSRSYDVPQRSGPSNDRTGYSVNPRPNSDNNRPNFPNSNRGNSRGYDVPQRSGPSNDRPAYNPGNSNSGRGYSQPRYSAPPQRSYSPPPQRSYSQAPSGPRGYSAPSRSYGPPAGSNSAPSRSYSAPSHSGGSGGGGSHSGGGGSHSGGGGSSHSSGGGGSHSSSSHGGH